MASYPSRAIQIDQNGGPEQLKLVQVQVGEPAAGEIRVRHHAVGLNFIDVYHRVGLYPMPMPLQLGMEAAGVIEAVGEGVSHLAVGDRVAYASTPPGSYCDRRVMPAKCVCKLPDAISFETGAAMMLKGLTAQYLLKRNQPQGGLQAGDFVLFHASAGGVGLIACQWARALGLQLIGTAGSDAKCALAKAWDKSLDCLQPFGLMVSFGNASGPVPPFAPGILGPKGSLYVTRQTLFTHISNRETTQAMADDLFEAVTSGKVKIHIDQQYRLEDVQQAHRDLEARKTTGCTVLTL